MLGTLELSGVCREAVYGKEAGDTAYCLCCTASSGGAVGCLLVWACPPGIGPVTALVGITALCRRAGYGPLTVLECYCGSGVLHWLGVYGVGQERLLSF
jgi:hypothetical protein